MKDTRITMGMPASVEVLGENPSAGIDAVFALFSRVDEQYSPYKTESEVSRVNAGLLSLDEVSEEYASVLALAEATKQETDGYFNIRRPDGAIDPSGIVKGWAIANAAQLLDELGYTDYCVDVGGDVAIRGLNEDGMLWSVGIRNPFNHDEIVKVLFPKGAGVATSGTAARGAHIYNPLNPDQSPEGLASITVIGPDVLEADRFATAAFAMGEHGILFIESRPGLEAYAIDTDGIATMTSGFDTHVTR